ncbi:MAG: choice-of-anchor J domain-containing protein [Bacteroidota bacterium]
MKNFTYLFLAGLFSIVTLCADAQISHNPGQPKPIRQTGVTPPRSCPTFEMMEKAFQADPAARMRYARTQQLLDQQTQQNRINPNAQFRVQAIINVPVVVHVLLPAAQQALVTDAIIQSQIDTLNFYYGGSPLNSDSLRVYEPFRTTYGRSEIRFCMAQRTPANLPTGGITRTVTSTIYDGSNTPGNAIVWDPTKYLNIWVVNAGNSGLLGYSYTPGTWGPSDPHQGFVNDYRAFGSGPGTSAGGYHYNEYNLGKTAVHEIGHYFNLAHTWGPVNDPPGNPGCNLSDGCADTPPTNGAFFGCPSAVPVTNSCTPAAPGIMWQNHMDYADDRCMVLFTKDQCARMTTAVTTAPDRIGLTTSNGCVAPPPAAGNDAGISAITTPATGSSISCSSVTPVVTIQNFGSNTLTSATINVRLNGTVVGTQPWTGSLAQGETANVTLATVNVPLGANTLKIHTTGPNGLGDAVAANDTSISAFTRIGFSALPLLNTFETSFLPTGWASNNPDGDGLSWFRFNPTGGAAGGSVWAAVIDNYDFELRGTVDDIVTPVVNTSTGLFAYDSLLITFDLAHKNFPLTGFEDSLKVLISTNCGATWTTVYSKGDPELSTAGTEVNLYNPPGAGDWKKQRISIGNNVFSAGQLQVAIRNVNGFGNVTWIDNINVARKPRKDMLTSAIVRPNLTECTPPFAPSITVRNNGDEAVTAFKTGYILNGGAPVLQTHNIPLAPGASTTVTFPALNAPAGTHTIKMFVTDQLSAQPGPDVVPSNDTMTRSFFVPAGTFTSVTEGFEGTAFPPANWFRINPDNAITWQRTTPGKSSNFSAYVDNYNYATGVYLYDYLQASPVNTAGADSLIITFDVAHKIYEDIFGESVDNLSVLISRNCANTFSSVYSKTGSTLATAGSNGDALYENPAQSDWRRERISIDLVTNPANSVMAQFRNGDAYGNSIFIDNINIAPVFKRDVEVLSISPDLACATAAYAPVARVHNRGTETVTGFTIAYTIGTGTPVIQNVTGITLAPNGFTNVTLTAGTLAAGLNNIKVYTSDPVTASGTGDLLKINDTLAKAVYATAAVPAPLTETFEGNFLPAGWAVTNADGLTTWQKSSTGLNSSGSAFLRNYGYFGNGQRDQLFTPVFTVTGVDSMKLTFDLSAATRDYPGSTNIGMDTLEVLVTKDCGNTYTSVYKKWGIALQTINDPNTPVPVEYTPSAYYLWRKETIDLSSFAPDGPIQVVFRNTTNNQNNVYIDNVNFTTKTFPARLAEGVIATPNPFTEQFNIWYMQPPADLRYVTVYNAAGKLVWNKAFGSGSTSNVINIDLTGKSAGVYIVNLGYGDKSKDTQIRIMKAN